MANEIDCAHLDKALISLRGWIEQNIDLFLPVSQTFAGGLLANLKHCSELVLGLTLAERFCEDKWTTSLLAHLWDRAFDKGEILYNVLLAKPDTAPLLGVYANFMERGFLHPGLSKLAERYASFEWILNLPFPVWRIFDILNTFERLNLKPFAADWLSRSWIASRAPPWIVSIEIAYAITHEVFYFTDFGRRKQLTGAEIDYVRLALPVWLEDSTISSDSDLLAEMLLAQYFALFQLNFRSLQRCLDLQNSDGSFSGPERVRTTEARIDNQTVSFRANYHTSVVMLVLLSVAKSCLVPTSERGDTISRL